MNHNPFTSDEFTSVWLKHFNRNRSGLAFSFFKNIRFVKHRWLPVYINVGKNHTKGISYQITNPTGNVPSKGVYLLYDIPAYFNLEIPQSPELKCHRVKQYPGFLTELSEFKDLEDFMTATFGKRTNGKFNRYQKRLEACFDIRHEMYYGSIAREEYDLIFRHFRRLLEKRFLDKKITNNNLDAAEWNFYSEVVWPMIHAKKAALFVTYDSELPVAITLLYFSEDIVFDAIPVFDIDFKKFNLGTVSIMQLVQWCIAHNMKALDFSKGFYEYKVRWAKKQYDFEYHIHYNPKSGTSRTLAFLIKQFFLLKQILREKKLNDRLHRVVFLLKNRKQKETEEPLDYNLRSPDKEFSGKALEKIDLEEGKNNYLLPVFFDFLYLNSEKLKESTMYKVLDTPSDYLIRGKNSSQQITLKEISIKQKSK